jgi:tetratricopeptide (TPR) repeat protein
MQVLSPVEKVINLRKKYKISQKELSKDNIARSYLAIIESKKKSISPKVAEILTQNFNEIFKERGIDKQITISYLLEDEEEQFDKICNSLYQAVNLKNVYGVLKKIKSTTLKTSNSIYKILLFKKTADILFSLNEFEEAYTLYDSIIIDSLNPDIDIEFEEILYNMLYINIIFNNFNKNIDLENQFFSYIQTLENYKEKIFYLLGISHKNLNAINYALRYFEELEKIEKDSEKKFELKLLLAECYEIEKYFDKAYTIYRGLLLKNKSIYKKSIINLKLLILAKKSNDIEKSKFYIKKLKSFLKELNNNRENDKLISEIEFEFIEIAKILPHKKMGINSIKNILQNKLASIDKKYSSIKSAFYFADKNDILFINFIEEFYFELMKINPRHDIGFLFINYYIEHEFFDLRDRFLRKIKMYI